AQCIEQADRIRGHVAQRVRSRDLPSHQGLREEGQEVRRAVLRKTRRQADVAIVEADDEIASRGELLAKFLVPGDHLSGEPHDEEQRGGLAAAKRVVAELYAIGRGERGRFRGVLQHPPSPLDWTAIVTPTPAQYYGVQGHCRQTSLSPHLLHSG